MPTGGRKDLGIVSGPDVPGERGHQNDQRKWQVENKQSQESQKSQGTQTVVFQRPFGNAEHRLNDDGKNGRLEAEKQALQQSQILKTGVKGRQTEDDAKTRKYEQRTGDNPAAGPMQKPSDIGCQLLRLRARQKHAVIERMQETAFGYPAFFINQDLVHQRDLPCRSTEA